MLSQGLFNSNENLNVSFKTINYHDANINGCVRDGRYIAFCFNGPKEEVANIFKYVLFTLNAGVEINIKDAGPGRKDFTLEIPTGYKRGLVDMFRYLATFGNRYTANNVELDIRDALLEANSCIEKNEALPQDVFPGFSKCLQETILRDNKHYFDKLEVDVKPLNTPSTSL